MYYIMMYILNIAIINEVSDFISKNYYRQIGFTEENSYYSIKRQNKRFTIICNQINRKKYLIQVIPMNTINLI